MALEVKFIGKIFKPRTERNKSDGQPLNKIVVKNVFGFPEVDCFQEVLDSFICWNSIGYISVSDTELFAMNSRDGIIRNVSLNIPWVNHTNLNAVRFDFRSESFGKTCQCEFRSRVNCTNTYTN